MSDNAIPPEEQELEEAELDEAEDLPDDIIEEDDEQQSDSKDNGEPTEKRLKDTQRALTKKSQEAAELRKKLDELEQLKGELRAIKEMREAGQKEPQKEENPFAFLDDEATANTLLDDPKNVIAVQKKMLKAFADVLEQRDAFHKREMEKRLGSVATEEGRAIANRVAILKKDADYAGFSDQQLSVLAKKQIQRVKKPDTFKGGLGGKAGARGGAKGDDDAMAKDIFAKLYPDDKWED